MLRAADPSIRIATPATLLGRVLLAQDPEPPLTGTTVALSLSPGEDLARLTDGRVGSGITQEHLDDAVSSIALAALRSGARLAYGGDFRRSPYARGLIELYRTYGGLGSRGSAQLMYFVDPSARKSIEAAPTEFEPINVPALAGADRVGDLYKVLWSFAMRERMAELCTGRILLGGRSRPREVKGDRGYSGPWPGLLEEAWRTLRRGRALYVAGGFGGAAGAIAAMLATGAIPEAFTSAPRGTPFAALTERIDAARRELAEAGADPDVLLEPKPGQLARMEDLAHLVLQRWQHFESGDLSAWPNGLSLEDNRRLFRSTDRSEITYLVFEGLRRVSRGMDGELKLALYQGDIASVPHVDGYAIAVTPGVPRVGPSATLEARLNRPRVGVLAPQRPIEIVTVTNLPGTCVLVARLDLPSVGQPVHAATVERLAQDVAREADRVGLESVACPAFATEMGLSFQESTQAMLAGFRQGRGHFPAKLVFCEPDGVRYGLLRSALGPEVVELRVGPPLVRSIGPAVLHVSVEEPRSNTAGRVRCTLYIPDGNQSVAPLQEISVTRTTWQFLLRRLQEFDDAIRTGRALWRELLSEEIRTQLIQLGERSLVVLGDEMASRLPWELLMEDRDGAMPLPGGVVRRIALQGSYRHPAEQVERSRLRVLIVADPRRDLDNAGAEADAVCDALGGRADVVVTRLDGDSATIAAVMTELMQSCYDVVHYVGHVAFDLDDPAHGGRLVLADGVLAAEDLPAVAPQLVILSACESGRLRDLEPTPSRHAVGGNGRSLAEAFLRAGVRAFVGTFYATDDESTRSFASIVHAELAAGRTLGNAIRAGRRDLYERRRVDWGNFLLFGDDDLIL